MQGKFETKTPLLAILDNMPFMAWYKDVRGRFIAINQPFADSIGKSREEIIGKTDFDVWPYDLALSYVADDNEVMRTRVKKSVEESIQDSAGGIWFETFKAPVFDDQDNVIGTIGMSKDISERVHFQLELEEQKQFIRSMIDASSDFIFFKDVNSVYLGCNKAFASQFIGLKEEEIIGKTDLDFVKDTELASFFRQKDMEVFKRKETLFNEETIQLVNGEWLDVETAKTPFFNKEGHLAGLIGISRDITARKKFEKQLKEQIEYSQMLLQTIPSGVYTFDKTKRITSWNMMAEVITGYAADEVLGKNIEQFSFHPCQEDCQLFLGEKAASPANMTCKIKSKHGETKYIFKTVEVLRNDSGDIIGQIECFDDITEKIFVEEQLKESQLRLSLAISNSNIGMWDWKIPTGELTLNQEWASMRGYTLSELGPTDINTWKQTTHPEDLTKAMDIINKCFAGELDLFECEIRLKHKDGHWVWVLDRGKVIERDAAGKPVRMIGTHIDITARKHAEEDLKEKERLLAALAMSIKELIENRDYIKAAAKCFELIGDAARVDRVYLFVNHQDNQSRHYSSLVVEWNSGIKESQLANPELQNIPFDELEGLSRPLSQGEGFYGIVRELEDDRVREFLVRLNILSIVVWPIFVRGEFWGVVGFGECKFERQWSESDFSTLSAFANSFGKTIERSLIESELDTARQSAEAANELKSQFVANISHEIRTPMHAILGYASLMKEQVLSEEGWGYLTAIQKAGSTLMNLINDVLDLSKIEAGKLELETSQVVLAHLFSDIKDMFSLRFQEKKLKFIIEIEEGLPEVFVLDEVRIRQILFNLVGNAVKFTDKGKVTVAVKASNCDINKKTLDLVFVVSDTGIGIPEEQQQSIFEPFKQKDGQNNKKYGGTGLGLSITKRLLAIMGGTIDVYSKPSEGAAFSFTIPNVSIGEMSTDLATAKMPSEYQKGISHTASDIKTKRMAQAAPPGLVADLEQLKQGLWLECSTTNRVSDIRKLAERIRDCGIRYQHEETIKFANLLQSYINAFDLKNTKLLLEEFPVMLENFATDR